MTRTLRIPTILAVTAPLACLLLTGCHVTENEHGNRKNVDIGTPFGSMKVHTNNSTDTSAIGLSAYPGAVPTNDSGDKDGNSANVDMSFGSFRLGVRAAGFQTPDQPDKVLAFYRKDLSRYSNVIECHGHASVGQPTRTTLGLTCSDSSKEVQINGSEPSNNNVELRAGSPQHQHIVSVEAHGGGTKIGLVALDLPSHLSGHANKDSEE